MREHEFLNGSCKHCGGIYKAQDIAGMTCVWRADATSDAVRPLPRSVFADLTEIGDAMKTIMAEEAKTRAGTPEIPEAADA